MPYTPPPNKPSTQYVCNETKMVFTGQKAIADWLHVRPAAVSEHITGKRDYVQGYLPAGQGREMFVVRYTFSVLKEE